MASHYSQDRGQKRILQLDGLRAVAFFAVFANHSINAPMMWVGVDVFFVLSGFLITCVLLRTKHLSAGPFLHRFYDRRFRRIVPAYCIIITIATAVTGISWGDRWYWYAFFLQNVAVAFFPPQGVLTPLWSLAVEEHFYLLWPPLVYYCSRVTLSRFLFAILLAAPLVRLVATAYTNNYLVIYCLTLFRVDLIAAGALLALEWTANPDRLVRHRGSIGVACVTLSVLFFLLAGTVTAFRAKANSFLFNCFGYSISVMIFGGVVAYVLALDASSRLYRALSHPWLRYLGAISYMMYLSHETALYLTDAYAPVTRPILALALTVGFSSLTWHVAERRILAGRADDLK